MKHLRNASITRVLSLKAGEVRLLTIELDGEQFINGVWHNSTGARVVRILADHIGFRKARFLWKNKNHVATALGFAPRYKGHTF